jgi:hypothetical protein
MPAHAILAVILAALGLAALLFRWPKLRGTTLVAPATWTMVVLLLLALAEVVISPDTDTHSDPVWASALRYLVGTATLCPSMALLGAKRPQNAAWQFIVVSLWMVLCLPSAHTLLFTSAPAPTLHAAQSWFLVILIVMTGTNYLPTRFALPSIIFSLAQVLLLYNFLPFATWWSLDEGLHQRDVIVALALFSTTIVVVCLGWPRPQTAKSPLDRLWLNFRDAYGAVWGLRVQQRINQAATMYGWKLRLDWHGFMPLEGAAISRETEKSVRDNLTNLLRRFVSPRWVAERLGEPLDCQQRG